MLRKVVWGLLLVAVAWGAINIVFYYQNKQEAEYEDEYEDEYKEENAAEPMASPQAEDYAPETNGRLAVHIVADISQSFMDSFQAASGIISRITGEIGTVPFELHVWLVGTRVNHLGPYTSQTIAHLQEDWPDLYRGKGVSWNNWNLMVSGDLRPRYADWFLLEDQHTNLTEGIRRALGYTIPEARSGSIASVFVFTDEKNDPPPEYDDNKYRTETAAMLADVPEQYQSRLPITVVSIGNHSDPEQVKRDILGGYSGAVTMVAGSWDLVHPIVTAQIKRVVGHWGWVTPNPNPVTWYRVPTQAQPLVIERVLKLSGVSEATFGLTYTVTKERDRHDGLAVSPDESRKLVLVVQYADGTPVFSGGIGTLSDGERVRFTFYENPDNSFGDDAVRHQVAVHLAPKGNAIILNADSSTGDDTKFGVQRESYWAEHWILRICLWMGSILLALMLFVFFIRWRTRPVTRRKKDKENEFEDEDPKLSGVVIWKENPYELSGDQMVVGALSFGVYPDGKTWVRAPHPLRVRYQDLQEMELMEDNFPPNEDKRLPDVREVVFVLLDPDHFNLDPTHLNGNSYTYRTTTAG